MQPLLINNRRELFVDDYLIESLNGGARRMLHSPQPREIVLEHDRAWEGNTCGYHTFLQDGGAVRAYYRGTNARKVNKDNFAGQVTCMAQSEDGIHFRKPNLGIIAHNGSTINNIIHHGVARHNFAPFIDTNPNCSPQQRYKAIGGLGGLYIFASEDGVHWTQLQEDAVITDGHFDSQNIAFWDSQINQYRTYYRKKTEAKVRGIQTATSPDFKTWTSGEWLQYRGAGEEQLYTNQILPYSRAPHIYLGFPTRFLPDRGEITEGIFMSSRDGLTFDRWQEALIRPGANRDRWGNRCNYIWQGIVETPSPYVGAPNELSIYSIEGYYEGNSCRVRRFAFRMDGFVSINAPFAGGEVVTKPLLVKGNKLLANISTAAAGSLRVEIQDEQGAALPGYSLEECDLFWGDEVKTAVLWNNKSEVNLPANKPIRLRFVMNDADLYAFRFMEEE